MKRSPMPAVQKPARLARQLQAFLQEKRPRAQWRGATSIDDLTAPALDFAIRKLQRNVSRSRILLESTVWRDLRKHLAQRLRFAVMPTFGFYQKLANAVPGSRPITLSEMIFDFPGILDSTVQIISAWLAAQRELIARLSRDHNLVSTSFFRRERRFPVAHIRPGLSDPHDCGRTVTLVQFSTGTRVIYKPRAADGEELWFAVLAWINSRKPETRFQIPRILPRKNYLWMEFLWTRSCNHPEDVSVFYFRWGAQAAIAQLLGAIDLHRENWLAVGSQPVLVDAEFIGQWQASSRRGLSGLDQRPLPALLESGLLPLIVRDRVGRYRGIGPFDSKIATNGPPSCWPRYNSKPQPPAKYVDDLVRGFQMVGKIFSAPRLARQFRREVIDRAPKSGRSRILLRTTAEYARLLRDSLQTRNLTSVRARWRYLLRECCLSARNRGIGQAEARALLRCDIPKFTAHRKALPLSRSGFSAAITRLKQSTRLLRRRILSQARWQRD